MWSPRGQSQVTYKHGKWYTFHKASGLTDCFVYWHNCREILSTCNMVKYTSLKHYMLGWHGLQSGFKFHQEAKAPFFLPKCFSSTSLQSLFYSFVVVLSLTCVWLFVSLWTAAHQASLSSAVSRSLLKLMSIESMMPSNHLILCCPLLLLPSIFPSIN